MDIRMERDSLGEIAVPADRLWGAQTQRSLHHFNISGERQPMEIIHALACIKSACARVNHALGLLPPARPRPSWPPPTKSCAACTTPSFP